MTLRVAVIGGGASSEHDVSLASAAAVRAALDPARYDIVDLTIGRDGTWCVGPGHVIDVAAAVGLLASCDVAFPALHGPAGEDGTLAALCRVVGVPWVGAGVGAGALAMDKWATKLVAEAVGLRTAPAVLLGRYDDVPSFTGPVVVKPVAAGSSHGVTVVRESWLLPPAVELARRLDDRVLVEQFVAGREVDVAVVEHPDGTRVASTPLEIVVGEGGVFDTATKYDGSARFLLPAPLPAATGTELRAAAVRAFDALGCSGLARVDFFVTDAGLVLNEVNTMPGMTEHSQLPRMMAHDGLPYARLLDVLIATALARP